jgi:alanine dehydrogenase
MIIGVPRETHRHEHRAGLTPSVAAKLVRAGHTVVVEKGAGHDAHFADRDYQAGGARIVYSREEAFGRADLVCHVGAVTADELEMLAPGSILCGFHHLAVAPAKLVERLMELELTVIGYEVIRGAADELPVLYPLSELAGQMAVHLAAHLLQNECGGRGILLGNVPGVPPPTVLILGAGTVGRTAAAQALASGAHVIVVDADLARLRALSRELGNRVVTAVAGLERLEKFTAIADVVLGAVLVPGGRAPFLVTQGMVQAMKPGSVVIDVAIDQGGCVETSRPTTLESPTFVAWDVVHYCVPNLTANIARTASRALAHAALPYLLALGGLGLDGALAADPGLARGVYLYRGRMVHELAGQTLGLPVASLDALLAGRRGA